MTARRITAFRVDEDLLDGLRRVQERDGVPVPEQVRRAIRTWLESKDVMKKAERKRAVTRRRP